MMTLALSLLTPFATSSEDALVVLNKFEATASILSAKSGELLETVAVGEGPHEAAVSKDGSTVVVCNYGARKPGNSLSILDMTKREIVKTIELEGFHRPHGIEFLDAATRVAVTAETEKRLLIVNLESGEVEAAIPTEQDASHMVVLDKDTSRAFVANIASGSISVLDIKEGKFLKKLETGAGAEGIDKHPTRPEVWVTNRSADTVSVVDTEKLEVVATIQCGKFPIRVKLTPDGKTAVVSCAMSAEVVLIDVEKREIAARIAMNETEVSEEEQEKRLFGPEFEGAVPVGILIPPAGGVAYVACTNADVVSVVDLAQQRVVGRLSAGREPDGLAWARIETAEK